MARVYVAGKWETRSNPGEAKDVMQALRHAGHTITHDWTISEENTAENADKDLHGVLEAQAFVGLFKEDLPYQGALVELGVALGWAKPIYILGNAPVVERCIFMKHPRVKLISSVQKLLKELKNGK